MLPTIPDEQRIVELSNKEVVYIKNPSRQIREHAESEGTKAYFRAMEDGCKMRSSMIMWLQDKGIWNNEAELEIARLQQEMDILLDKIEAGGIKKSEARSHSIRVVQIRNILNSLLSEMTSYLTETIEAKKRNAEFNYLVFACSVYNTDRRKQYYSTYDDYLNNKDTLDNDRIAAKCSQLFYGTVNLEETPEKVFLKENGFIDANMRLINEEGHLVDFDGRLIDEEGNYIKYVGTGKNKKAVLVDVEGKEIEPFVRKPFLDEDGNPIGVEKPKTIKKTKSVKKGLKEDESKDEVENPKEDPKK